MIESVLVVISCVFFVCHEVYVLLNIHVDTKWYVPVLTYITVCSGMSLVHAFAKVQNLLERGVNFCGMLWWCLVGWCFVQ